MIIGTIITDKSTLIAIGFHNRDAMATDSRMCCRIAVVPRTVSVEGGERRTIEMQHVMGAYQAPTWAGSSSKRPQDRFSKLKA